MRVFFRLTACMLASICGIGSARAQEAPRGELVTVERAHELYQRGLAAYQIGDYEVAVNAFLASWSMYEDPRLLYNLSLAYWKLGKLDQAIATATRVIDADVEQDVRVRSHARRAAFETIVLAQAAATEVRSVPDREVLEVEESSPTRAGAWTWLPWTTAAVTLGAIGGVAIVDRQIAATATEMEQAEADNEQTAAFARHAEIERRQLVGRVLLATVAVGATATVVLFLIRPRPNATDRTQVAFGLGPTGVTLITRFE